MNITILTNIISLLWITLKRIKVENFKISKFHSALGEILSRFWLSCLGPFGFIAPKIYIILLSNLSILNVPDEGYSSNASCALNLISTFSFLNNITYLCVMTTRHTCFAGVVVCIDFIIPSLHCAFCHFFIIITGRKC